MYDNQYVVTDTESLRILCMRNNWFTSGSINQYEKMFDCNMKPNSYTLRDIAMFIYATSDDEFKDIVVGLVQAREEHLERVMGPVNESIAKGCSADASVENKNPFGDLQIGDRVKVSMRSYDGSIPQWLDGCNVTIIGFTKNGSVKCDYDGGKPFYINPCRLEKSGGERSKVNNTRKRHVVR